MGTNPCLAPCCGLDSLNRWHLPGNQPNSRSSRFRSPLGPPFPRPDRDPTPRPASPARRGRTRAPLPTPTPPATLTPYRFPCRGVRNGRSTLSTSPHRPPPRGSRRMQPGGDCEITRQWAAVRDTLPPDSGNFGSLGNTSAPPGQFSWPVRSAGCPNS